MRAEDTWWEEWALAQGLEKKGGGEERGGGGRWGRDSGDEFFPRGEGNNEFFPVGTRPKTRELLKKTYMKHVKLADGKLPANRSS